MVVQGRVVYALILREVHTIYGSSKLGYLWAVLQTAFGVAVFWGIRVFVGVGAPHGMSVIFYLLVGFTVWHIFNDTILKCMSAVKGNNALLTFPQVTPLDLMVARTMVVWLTQLLSFFLIAFCAITYGENVTLTDPGAILFVCTFTPVVALGFGLLLSSLAVLWPTLDHIVPMVLRILFFTSGVFFSTTSLSQYVASYLLYNPILQCIEIARQGISASYYVVGCSYGYVFWLGLTVLMLGLLFERYVRKRVMK